MDLNQWTNLRTAQEQSEDTSTPAEQHICHELTGRVGGGKEWQRTLMPANPNDNFAATKVMYFPPGPYEILGNNITLMPTSFLHTLRMFV